MVCLPYSAVERLHRTMHLSNNLMSAGMQQHNNWRGSNNLGGSGGGGGGSGVKVAGMNFDVAAEADLAALAIMKEQQRLLADFGRDRADNMRALREARSEGNQAKAMMLVLEEETKAGDVAVKAAERKCEELLQELQEMKARGTEALPTGVGASQHAVAMYDAAVATGWGRGTEGIGGGGGGHGGMGASEHYKQSIMGDSGGGSRGAGGAGGGVGGTEDGSTTLGAGSGGGASWGGGGGGGGSDSVGSDGGNVGMIGIGGGAILTATRDRADAIVADAEAMAVGSGTYHSPRHPCHFDPSFLESKWHSVTCRASSAGLYLPAKILEQNEEDLRKARGGFQAQVEVGRGVGLFVIFFSS